MADPTLITDSIPRKNQPAEAVVDPGVPAAEGPLSVAALRREIGRRLRARRRERRFSQEELGWRARCHRTYISQIERGTRNPTLASLYRLALALDVPIAELCPGPGVDGPDLIRDCLAREGVSGNQA